MPDRDGPSSCPEGFPAGLHVPQGFERERDLRSGHFAEASTWRLGPVVIGEFATPAQCVAHDLQGMGQGGLDHIVLRAVVNGPTLCQSRISRLVVQPGDLVIGTFARAYEEILPAGRCVTAILDRDAFPEFRDWAGVPQRLRGSSAVLLAGMLAALPDALRHMQPEEECHLARALRIIIPACLAGCMHPGPAEAADAQALLRLKVDRIIAANLSSSRLTPGRVAQLAGVSRSTLYRAFKAEGGIAQRILQQRMLLVQRDLETPLLDGVSIARIAERRGLHNAASFHRAFRQHCGETPGDYRATAQALRHAAPSEVPPGPASGMPAFRQLPHLPTR